MWDLFEEQDSVLRCDELKDCRALQKPNRGRLQFWISGETALPALICKRIPAQHSLNAVNYKYSVSVQYLLDILHHSEALPQTA